MWDNGPDAAGGFQQRKLEELLARELRKRVKEDCHVCDGTGTVESVNHPGCSCCEPHVFENPCPVCFGEE